MSNGGKRALASLFGIHLNEDVPQLQSLVPQRVSNEILSGTLPKFSPATLMLGKNETCHFMDKAAVSVLKTEKLYQNRNTSGSYRLTKKIRIHTGGGTTRPVEQSWYEFKEGVVFVTNERIVFVSPENGFEKKIKNLTAIIPYSDAIAMQFDDKTITLVVPQPQLMAKVLKMLH